MNAHQRYLIEEFAEDYRENRLSRRDLLKRGLLITGSIPTTASVLLALGCGAKSAPQAQATVTPTAAPLTTTTVTDPPAAASATGVTVPPTDPAIEAQEVRFAGPAGDLLSYLSRPRAGGPYPAVLVIHENQGLQEHIKDVTRRYAKEGFVALALDLLSRQGGTERFTNPNEATGAFGRLNPDDGVADLLAAINYLRAQPFVRQRALGVTGFCAGGSFTWRVAIASPAIRAAVPYYGTVDRLEDLAKIQAAILAVYGGEDTRVTSQAPQVEERLRAAGKTFEIRVYPGAQHAFFNDQRGERYHPQAARAAWQETLAWFRQHLATG